MKTFVYYSLLFCCILFVTCQKEISFENAAPSKGSLMNDSTGNCYPKTVNGAYVVGTALKQDTNTIQVTVNVTVAGSYTILSDTVNGYWFKGTGTFSHTGTNSATLKGYGTPVAQGVNNFLIVYDSTACNVAVTVAPAGTGAASFTINSSGGSCSDTLYGTYTQNVALNSSNYIILNVHVDTIGTYNISGTVDSMTFSGSGTFSSTGNQVLQLNGSGTPHHVGNDTLHLTAGSSACNIVIVVNSGSSNAVGTLGGGPGACTPDSVYGTYTQNTALTTADSVHIQITVTTAGTYNISTNTVNGFSFSSGTGTASLGTQTITLHGTGTPTASGNITFTVTFGTSTCTFVVNVAAAALSDYFPTVTTPNNDNWTYDTTDWYLGGVHDTLYLKAAGTISLNSQTYTYFLQTSQGTSNFDSAGYYRKNASKDYFQWLDVGYFFVLDNSVWGEFTFLKDYVPAGTEWSSASFSGTVGGFPVLVHFKDSIQQKDVSVTVQGTPYPNTIIVKEKYEYSADGGSTWNLLEYSLNYYSRNIGLIKTEYFEPTNSSDFLQEIRGYHVY